MIGVMPARCLSVHASYRCRHSGECCSGVFPIPAEPRVVELVRRLGIGGQPPAELIPATPRSLADLPAEAGSNGDVYPPEFLATRPDGRCVFWSPAENGSCAIHRQAGPDALPSACRHFPRAILHDGRGVFLSLSHFCPTAAGLLFEDGPLAIVEAAAPLAIGGPIEPFEADGTLPPLLRPGVLTDLDGYDAWERECVRLFALDDLSHAAALDRIAAATETVRTWKPGAVPLQASVTEAFRQRDGEHTPPPHLDEAACLALVNAAGLIRAGCPIQRSPTFDDEWERHVAATWSEFDRPIARYLAARLFGHRIAYECRGLRSIVEWLRVSLAVLRHEAARLASAAGVVLTRNLCVEAVRAADLLLVHRVDTAALARGLEPIETKP
jgi:Fe-S-cluster containining protein